MTSTGIAERKQRPDKSGPTEPGPKSKRKTAATSKRKAVSKKTKKV